MLELVTSLLGWYACNAAFNVVNKEALNLWPHPWVVAWLQLLVGVLVAVPLWVLRARSPPRVSVAFLAREFGPIGALHAFGHGAQVLAFGEGSVFTANVVKALEPVVGTLVGWLCLGRAPKPLATAALAPVVGGVVYAASKPGVGASLGDLATRPAKAALLSTVAFAFAKVLAKRQMTSANKKERNFTAPNVYGLLTCSSCAALTLPAALLAGAVALPSRDALRNVALSGFFYYASNEFSFRILDLLGPVSQAVANAAKRVFVLAAAVAFLGETVTPRKLHGSAIALGGVLAYGLAR